MRFLITIGLCFLIFRTDAQAYGTVCDTIVLQNKREILVHIDSMKDGILYYRPCPEDNGLTRTMPVSYIKRINGNSAAINAVPHNEGKVLRKKSDLIGQEWTFKHRKELKTIVIPASREVKLHYKENNSKRKRKGHIVSIGRDSIVFQTTRHGLITVPKVAVTEISIPKKVPGLGIITGVFGIIIGIGGIGMFLLLALLATLLTGNPNNASRENGYQTGCLMAALGIGIGILLIMMSMPRSIMMPFSDRWNIVETGAPQVGEEGEVGEKP